MENNVVTSHLENLCRRRPSVHSILKCSPFDASRNLDKSITPEIFFNYLFVENKSCQELRDKLYEQLTNSLRNYQIIFLEGFSGTGKTTFIKYFVQSYKGAIPVFSRSFLVDNSLETV